MISRIRSWWRQRRLQKLLDLVRDYEMTPEEREAQRRDFAYGNVRLSNPEVTREMVDKVADEMNRQPNRGRK
jgi:hypothetical protein